MAYAGITQGIYGICVGMYSDDVATGLSTRRERHGHRLFQIGFVSFTGFGDQTKGQDRIAGLVELTLEFDPVVGSFADLSLGHEELARQFHTSHGFECHLPFLARQFPIGRGMGDMNRS